MAARSSEHRFVCGDCRRWLVNVTGKDFSVEIKCPKCGAVVTASVRDGVVVSVETKARPVEQVA